MPDKFNTISSPSEGIYKDKGSKFLSFAIPVKDEEAIKDILETYRKKYHDARHVCYAYMLGEERNDFRANDDGEPSGTAGRPILGQINSFELTNILIIVVRYFGGILLGTGGLVTAYKEAAADAIRNAKIIEKTIVLPLSIHFSYELMSEVSRLIKEFDLKITDQKFEIACDMTFAIPKSIFENVKDRFKNIYGIEII
ncbi:MAG: YigZ family protein [Bacteroidales bacterium]|nr:YigZ family protein [Bacteroidales bacterium]